MTLTPFNTALFRALQPRAVSASVLASVFAALLSACGGGDTVVAPQDTANYSALVASAPVATPPVYVDEEVRFGGGACVGGNSDLTTTWFFGDGSGSASTGVHTYRVEGRFQVRVECKDTAGASTAAVSFFNVCVRGKEWSDKDLKCLSPGEVV